MKKTFTFKKIGFNGYRKINLPEVEVNIYNDDTFSITGNIWNCHHTDIVIGGQCLDTMNKYSSLANDNTFKMLYTLWKSYHLKNLKDIPDADTIVIKSLFN